MQSTKATMSPQKEPSQSLVSKWGKDLIDSGWTALPNVIFQNQKELGLKPLDVLILLHLSSYWRIAGQPPRPSKGSIAASVDVDPRTVQRSIKKMEDLGYVKRIAQKGTEKNNLPNEYDLTGLLKTPKVQELAKIVIDFRKTRAKENSDRELQERNRRSSPGEFALKKKSAQ